MKAHTPLTNAQKRAMNKEIDRQLVEKSNQWMIDVEAMVLMVLHKYYGFGKKRLLKFRRHFIDEVQELKRYYGTDDITYPVAEELKELGVDIKQLNIEEGL